jgi:hypothetical protein
MLIFYDLLCNDRLTLEIETELRDISFKLFTQNPPSRKGFKASSRLQTNRPILSSSIFAQKAAGHPGFLSERRRISDRTAIPQ